MSDGLGGKSQVTSSIFAGSPSLSGGFFVAGSRRTKAVTLLAYIVQGSQDLP